ncbi:MAG: hypothetical protein ACJ762_06545 [Solirubrobacteraceae bacterium]
MELALGMYRVLREQAHPEDEYDIELAILDEVVYDFELAIEFADTDDQALRARESIEAAHSLRRAIMALVASPGPEG